MRLLIGTYTRGTKSEGIYSADFDPETGQVRDVSLFVQGDNPSYLVVHDQRLFVCSEVADADDGGEIVVFEIGPERVVLSQVVSSRGADPCHLAIKDDRLAVANYTGGTLALLAYRDGRIQELIVNPAHAGVGPHERQQAAHPHGVYFIGDELWVTDLGTDEIVKYSMAYGDHLGTIEITAGSGPRHLTTDGRFLVNELANTACSLENGAPSNTVSTLPDGWTSDSMTAEIEHRNGCVYVSNRGHNSIAVFDEQLTRKQTVPSGGRHPRHFTLNETNNWLVVANKDTDNIVVFDVRADGTLGGIVSEASCPAPTCVIFG